jgi:phenylalanyl-tRNA synthetase beta subunit
MDRSLTNEEIDALQEQVRDLTVQKLGVELR